MAEKIIVSFSGWCECNPDKVNFVKTCDQDGPEVITGREWLALPEWDEDIVGPTRDYYMLESTADAQATAVDGDYDFWSIDVEEE